MTLPRGIIPAVATPLTVGLAPDAQRLVQHCRALLDVGADGINLLGTTGEAMSFSVKQRIALMQAVAEAGMPLERFLVGSGAAALEDSIELTQAAEDLGYAGALVMPPFFYKDIEPLGLVDFFSRLRDRANLRHTRLVLYNYPKYSGITFSDTLVSLLREVLGRQLGGLKDSSAAPGYADSLARQFSWLHVYPSNEASLAEQGHPYAGSISATLNLTVPMVVAGDFVRSRQLREALVALPLVSAVKWTLSRVYGDEPWQRITPPLRQLTQTQAAALEKRLGETPLEFRFSRAASASHSFD